MGYVKPKKRFGQHYLRDENVLLDILEIFKKSHTAPFVLEIGPGMGALTQFLWRDFSNELMVVELDRRCVAYLQEAYPCLGERLIQSDILKVDLDTILPGPTSVIGNFPYNISTQIVFKILEHHQSIPLVVGMFQKEVAMRLASGPGSRVYGVTSVLAQLHYDIEVSMHIAPEKFDPPPKVDSTVITMKLHGRDYNVDEQLFRKVVKAAFSTRRKKLKNALSGISGGRQLPPEYAEQRAEQLSVPDYIALTHWYAADAAIGSREVDANEE
jgi:16S rRNA (adenine1518-N6/adenine1519-N6)-dimethyltransferase